MAPQRRGRPPKNPGLSVKRRPLRTRDHVIANLSILHFQWLAVSCGYIAEEPQHDYGYDLTLFTYTDAGEIENGSVLFQFKATDEIEKYILSDGRTLSYPIERRHIALWRDEPMPVILIVYDAVNARAYWLYTQRYFKSADFVLTDGSAAMVSLHIPLENVVDTAAIRAFRDDKNAVLRRIRGVTLHDKNSNLPANGEGLDDAGL